MTAHAAALVRMNRIGPPPNQLRRGSSAFCPIK
jgi:hypothetical protein